MAEPRETGPRAIQPLSQPLPLAREEPEFYQLAQSPSSNQLQKKITERIADPAQLDLLGTGTIASQDFRLFIRGYSELVNGVNQSAAMLLDSLVIKATDEGLQSTLVVLPLREYMAMRGLKDEKATREQVKRDIDALERVSFEYKGTGKQRGVWLKVSIAGGTVGQIKNGDIFFRFNEDFFDNLKVNDKGKYLFMHFHHEALRGNINQNPYKYWFARKISEHKRINIGKPNEDSISVKALINACPNFPAYEEVVQSNGAVTQRMIEPFERDMNELYKMFQWNYAARSNSPQDYQTFISAVIEIHWCEYPDIRKLANARAKRQKKK